MVNASRWKLVGTCLWHDTNILFNYERRVTISRSFCDQYCLIVDPVGVGYYDIWEGTTFRCAISRMYNPIEKRPGFQFIIDWIQVQGFPYIVASLYPGAISILDVNCTIMVSYFKNHFEMFDWYWLDSDHQHLLLRGELDKRPSWIYYNIDSLMIGEDYDPSTISWDHELYLERIPKVYQQEAYRLIVESNQPIPDR